MKSLFITALAAITIGTSAFAAPTIKTKAKSHFATSFSKAQDVSWNTNDKFNQASFLLNNQKVTAFYDVYGSFVGTTKTVDFDKLPKGAIESIVTNFTFPEYQLKECIEYVNADGLKKYYVSFQAADAAVVLEISENGRVDLFQGNAIQ